MDSLSYSNSNSNSNSPSLNYTYKCLITLQIPSRLQITCLAINKSLLYAASINQITTFHLSDFTQINTFTTTNSTSGGYIKSIAFHNSKIFTAHQDSKIRIWRISDHPRRISTLPTVKDRLRRSILPGNYVTVRRHRKRLWIRHSDTVSGLALYGGLMYSVSWDKSFKIWNVETRRCLESVTAHHDAVNAVAVSQNGAVFTGSADGTIRVWEKLGKERKHSMVATLKKHKSTVNALALNGDGSVLFSGGSDRSIVVWERRRDQRMVFVETLWGHGGAVLCLMNVDCLLVSGSSDRTVRIWEHGRKSGYGCMLVMEGHEKPIKSLVEVRRSGCNCNFTICSGSLDGEIKVWEISN